MDARRLTFAVVVVGGLSAWAGCRSPASAPADPFAVTPAASSNSAPGTSISPVSYETPAAPAPGTSLSKDFEAEPKSWWQQLNHNMSSKEIKRKYKSLIGRAPDERVARQAYNEGDALFRAGQYDEAAEKFAVAADRWPESLLEEDALYMLGESYFFANRYNKACGTFQDLLGKYENSRHLDRISVRQFSLGRYWDEVGRDKYTLAPNFTDNTRPWFDTHGNGIKVYENIRLTDPTGPLADDAVMAQGTAYFLDERFDDASFQFEIMRKDYPQSEHQKQAHLLGLQSYLNAYQGPQYDPTPLNKADTLADSTIRNLSHQMPEERPRLHEAKDSIRAQKAEREYDVAEYYRRLGYNRAARQHYANVLREFPDTRFAQMAQQQMTATERLAPEPPDYFPWLTNWLGRR